MNYFAEYAWLPDGLARNVRIEVTDGRFGAITVNATAQPGDERLPGLVLPGIANTHSHAFHRALRGRTQRRRWHILDLARTHVSGRGLARSRFLLRAREGDLCRDGPGRRDRVGEFHYLHHGPERHALRTTPTRWDARCSPRRTRPASGSRCSTPAISPAVSSADGYRPLDGPQLRFGDGTATDWAERVSAFGDPGAARQDRGRDPFGAGRAGRPVRADHRNEQAHCTCTCRSSRPRTNNARPATESRRPNCLTRPACSQPARQPCMQPI